MSAEIIEFAAVRSLAAADLAEPRKRKKRSDAGVPQATRRQLAREKALAEQSGLDLDRGHATTALPSAHPLERILRAADGLTEEQINSVVHKITRDQEKRLSFRKARQRRNDKWQAAEALTSYLNAWRDFTMAAGIAVRHDVRVTDGLPDPRAYGDDGPLGDAWHRVCDAIHAAVAAQLMTPAPYAAAVAWKKSNRQRAWRAELSLAQIDAVIAADEAFLKACPRGGRKARSR